MLGMGMWKDEWPKISPGDEILHQNLAWLNRDVGSTLFTCSGTSPEGKPERWRAVSGFSWSLGKFVRFSFLNGALDAETEDLIGGIPAFIPAASGDG